MVDSCNSPSILRSLSIPHCPKRNWWHLLEQHVHCCSIIIIIIIIIILIVILIANIVKACMTASRPSLKGCGPSMPFEQFPLVSFKESELMSPRCHYCLWPNRGVSGFPQHSLRLRGTFQPCRSRFRCSRRTSSTFCAPCRNNPAHYCDQVSCRHCGQTHRFGSVRITGVPAQPLKIQVLNPKPSPPNPTLNLRP